MKNASISCIIPVFNMRLYVADAIRSVLNQTKPACEIIVVDDGSTDSTRREIDRFGNAVNCVYQANAGVSAARNHGLQRSSGEFICFLDADDRFHPNKLADQHEFFACHPDLQFCDGHARFFWSEEIPEQMRRADHRYAHAFWQKSIPGHISTWMVRRSVFEQIGGFDESLRFSEDTDWLLRARDAKVVRRTLPHCLAFRRLHPGNATAGNRQFQVAGLARVYARDRSRRRER